MNRFYTISTIFIIHSCIFQINAQTCCILVQYCLLYLTVEKTGKCIPNANSQMALPSGCYFTYKGDLLKISDAGGFHLQLQLVGNQGNKLAVCRFAFRVCVGDITTNRNYLVMRRSFLAYGVKTKIRKLTRCYIFECLFCMHSLCFPNGKKNLMEKRQIENMQRPRSNTFSEWNIL